MNYPEAGKMGKKEIKTLWKQALVVNRVLAGLFHYNWRQMLIDSPAFQKGKTTNSKNTKKQEQMSATKQSDLQKQEHCQNWNWWMQWDILSSFAH